MELCLYVTLTPSGNRTRDLQVRVYLNLICSALEVIIHLYHSHSWVSPQVLGRKVKRALSSNRWPENWRRNTPQTSEQFSRVPPTKKIIKQFLLNLTRYFPVWVSSVDMGCNRRWPRNKNMVVSKVANMVGKAKINTVTIRIPDSSEYRTF